MNRPQSKNNDILCPGRRRPAPGLSRRTLLSAALGGGIVWAGPGWARSNARNALRAAHRRSCEWLWDQQSRDGAWKSTTYGLLRSGQAYTPFVLFTLLQAEVVAGPAADRTGNQDLALDFIGRHVNREGALGMSDPEVLEYPVYATSFAVRCFTALKDRTDADIPRRMTAYLAASQFQPDLGFGPEHLAYGGWGFGGRVSPAVPGHMDLTHTRCALQALQDAGQLSPETAARARHFLRVVQRWPGSQQPAVDASHPAAIDPPCDGGFYFSPIVAKANKGRSTESNQGTYFRSYASATSDGVLALLACGEELGSIQVQAARRWLENNPGWEYPDGVPRDDPEPWAEAIRFNYWSSRAAASQSLRLSDWTHKLAALLLTQQQADGRFQNRRSHLMKEDDPLLATALAIQAMTACLNA